jgi:hypothetical protein
MGASKPLLLVLWQATSRRLVDVTFEHKIVAEGIPEARPG